MKQYLFCLGIFLTAFLLIMPQGGVFAVTDAELMNDQRSTENVLTNGLGHRGQRYSPLASINKSNVSGLVPAWAFSFGGEKMKGLMNTIGVPDERAGIPAFGGGWGDVCHCFLFTHVCYQCPYRS